MRSICSVNGCDKKVQSIGMCMSHSYRMLRYGNPLLGKKIIKRGFTKEWIVNHINYKEEDCLIWPFARDDHGYGRCGREKANRIMCTMVYGEKPSNNHEVAHTCGKGHTGCINPIHLRWATKKENMTDKIVHGTENKGERNGKSILSTDQIKEIRNLHPTLSYSKIAKKYSVATSTISDVVKKRRWSHIE